MSNKTYLPEQMTSPLVLFEIDFILSSIDFLYVFLFPQNFRHLAEFARVLWGRIERK